VYGSLSGRLHSYGSRNYRLHSYDTRNCRLHSYDTRSGSAIGIGYTVMGAVVVGHISSVVRTVG